MFIADDDFIVSVVADDAGASESRGNPGSFLISANGNATEDVTIQAWLTGAASSGDYSTGSTFPAVIRTGTSSTRVTIQPYADSLVEANEFACTPNLFPDLMAAAIQHRDIAAWAARQEIVVRRTS